MNKKRVSAHYIDNKRFYAEMKDYIDLCREASETDDECPIIPNYLGECFYKISMKLANRPNFASYSYKDEMIGDAIENCIHYIKSFNPEKSTNPFAYFTQIAWNAFVARINKEKKQQYVKYKGLEHMVINGTNFVHSLDGGDTIITTTYHENTQEFIKTYEENIEKTKRKKEEKLAEKRALENFIEDENDE